MKKIIFILLSLICLNPLYSQVQLNNQAASWSSVLPGKVICEPQMTSYGFSIITDARCLQSYTTEGKLLWEHRLPKGTSHFFSVLNDDFFAIITGNKLSLLNPSGCEIWQKTLDYKPTEKPYPGRDGRFFIRNSNTISCYSMIGVQKWQISTSEQNNLPVQELPDGTLVVFLKKTEGIKTKGLRISPFGEIMEEITFYGNVTSAETCEKGVLLTFSDSTCGLFSLEDGLSKHKWVLQKERLSTLNNDFFVSSKDKKDAVYIYNNSNGCKVSYINLNDGNITKTFDVPEISNPIYSSLNPQGLFLANKSIAVFYNSDGKFMWSGVMPKTENNSKKSWKYYIYTDNNYLIIFYDSWDATAYRTTQSLRKLTQDIKIERKNYNDLYDVDYSSFELALIPQLSNFYGSDDRINTLITGNYGEKEKNWISDLISGCNSYQKNLITVGNKVRDEYSIFEVDGIGLEIMISQLCFYGIDTFCTFTANVLKNEKNRTIINKTLIGLKYNGYDPEEKILYTLEALVKKTKPNDVLILNEICDAVYSICMFMGRPAFNKHGKEMLSNLLYPDYNSKTRDYVRLTLKKISELDL